MQKLMKLVENIAVYMAERSMARSPPFCIHEIEKPDRQEELVKRSKENKEESL